MVITLATAAWAAGFSAQTEAVSSYGPDAYATVRITAHASPGIEVGTLLVGGTQPAWLMTTARTIRLSSGFTMRGEVAYGVLRRVVGTDRQNGPTWGLGGGFHLDTGPVVVVSDLQGVSGLGVRGAAGVDVPLGGRTWLEPRVRVETWAGGRDPALRVGMGLRHERPSGWWGEVSASVGGRDVLHMGPGAAVSVGRSP